MVKQDTPEHKDKNGKKVKFESKAAHRGKVEGDGGVKSATGLNFLEHLEKLNSSLENSVQL